MSEQFTLAVDVGNTRIKFGVFDGAEQRGTKSDLPVCRAVFAFPANEPLDWEKIASRFKESNGTFVDAAVAGVNPAGVERVLSGWPRDVWPAPRMIGLAAQLPLRVNVELPDQVGIDRLLDAVAANLLRGPAEPAVVVDAGTATTVNLVSAEGAFEGGAILPGLELGARALHQYTALLPNIDVQSFAPIIPALGRDTPAAMRSGLWFGHVGAIREVVARLTELAERPPFVLVTGGNGRGLAQALGAQFRYEPDLALRGLAAIARQ